MRKVLFAIAASAALATPALANEARVEARGGVAWSGGSSEATAGIAAGYDFDLGSSAFAGLEVSGDKVLASGSIVSVGFTGRAGIKAGEKARLFAAGGYSTAQCSGCGGNWNLGAGGEFDVAEKIYLKAEYRHFFKNNTTFVDGDALVAGVGFRF